MKMNKKAIISIVLCLAAVFMGVGYSILSSNLKITGGANITSTWDVRITGIVNDNASGSAYNLEEPSFTNDTARFRVALVDPGDSMTYTITIENQGTITAILNNLNITTSGTDAIIYEVTGIKEGDTLTAGQSVNVTVVARYNSNVIADPDVRVKTLSVGLEWGQYTNQVVLPGTYTINYNANGGSGSMGGTTCTVGSNCTLATNTFTNGSYPFVGWSTSAAGAVVYGNGQSVKNLTSNGKTVTLYAVWDKSGEKEFSYTGGPQIYTVSVSGNYQLEVYGAEGGYRGNANYSGKGGYAVGTVYLTEGTTLYVYVGGNGNNHYGYNGGGRAGFSSIYGGGATDIRINNTSLYARVIVAGGGGSVGAPDKKGGAGGGDTGGTTTESFYGEGCSKTACGQGGTQTAGGTGTTNYGYTATAGSFGQGGQGFIINGGYGGAGGGGWYGGSGSVPDVSGDDDRGGGGGSGFIYTSDATIPSGYLLNSSYYLTSASMSSGVRSGDGFARIKLL